MAITQLNNRQVLDEGIFRADLNSTTTGNAVIKKAVAGTGISFSSTGIDAGTGDVTINIGAGAITNSMLAGSITSSKLVGTDIATVGTITSGTWNGTVIGATYGGTGQTVYAVGDLLYASTTTALSRLADVATTNVLISGGVGVAPSWGKVTFGHHSDVTISSATSNDFLRYNGSAWVNTAIATVQSTVNYWTSASSRLSFNGGIGIGTSSLASASIYISKPIIGGTTAYGIFSLSEVDNTVTAAAYGQYTSISTKATSFTLGLLVHNRVGQGTIGAGSSVTNQYGFWIDATLIGATNNYAFRCQIPAGTNRWNLYIDGTAQNYLGGNLVMNAPILYKSYAFASLPTGVAYMRAFVTDSNTAVFGATVAAGGANRVPVWYDATAAVWKVG